MAQETRANHTDERVKVPLQHMDDRQFVMTVRFLQETQIALESILALESLNLLFHDRDIGR